MTWFTRFQRESPEPGVATPRSVTFDMTGLRVESRTSERVEWRDLDEDRYVASVDRDATTPWPRLSNLDALRAYYREDAAARMRGLVSVDVLHVCGLPAAQVITKGEDLPAYDYEGSLVIPLRNARYTLTMHAREHGTTGTREAVVTGHLLSQGLLAIPSGPATGRGQRVKGWFRDPYDTALDDAALYSLSDDERLDELFPQHPLTKIRRWLATAPEAMAIDQSVRPDRPEEIQSLPTESPSIASTYLPPATIGLLYLTADRFDAAEQFFAESIPMREGEPAVSDIDVAGSLTFLGLAREMQENFSGAEWALSRAHAMFERSCGDLDPKTKRAESNLARVYLSLGRIEDAGRLFERALPMLEEQGTDIDVAVALNGLGLVRSARAKHLEAVPFFERAVERFERAEDQQGQQIPDCATALANLAASFEAVGNRRGAKDARARVRRRQRDG